MRSTLQRLCQNSFKEHSEQTVLQLDETGEMVTYSEAEVIVCAIEKRLYQKQIRPGDRVCSISPLNFESVLLAWACFRQGIVYVPIDHTWAPELLNFIVDEVEAKLVLIESTLSFQVQAPIVVYNEGPVYPRFTDWLYEGDDSVVPEPPTLSEPDAALILYTSGSTGRPKGVVLSQGGLFRSGQLVADLFDWQQDDVFINLGDLHSMSGLRNTCITPLFAGCSAVIATETCRSSALLLPDMMQRNGCTFAGVSPIVIRQLNVSATRFESEAFSGVRALLCTGGFLDSTQVRLFYDKFSLPVLNYYGLTETSGLCAGHDFSSFDPDEVSIGPAVGATLQIVDEDDNPVPNGTPGALRIKSHNLMLGYYKRPVQTHEVLKNGWYYTGDIAEKRGDGHFILRGRSRNVIKSVYTDLICLEEVEQALERHAGISEAGICGYTSEFGDERMAAFVVLNEPLRRLEPRQLVDVLMCHVAETLGPRKVPHQFYPVDHLTRSPNGKLLRHKLKELRHATHLS